MVYNVVKTLIVSGNQKRKKSTGTVALQLAFQSKEKLIIQILSSKYLD